MSNWNAFFRISFCVLLLSLFTSTLAFADTHSVIIGLKNHDSPAQKAKGLLSIQVQAQGGEVEHSLNLINAIVARVSGEQIQVLRQNPNVEYIVPDSVVATPERWASIKSGVQAEQNDGFKYASTPIEFYPWGVKRVDAPAVHHLSPSSIPENKSSNLLLPTFLIFGLIGTFRFLSNHNPLALSQSRIILFVLLVGIASLTLGGCTWAWVPPHPGILGEGVEVALLDTGIDMNNPDLQGNYLGGVDFVHGDLDPFDDNGHGTGVAGVLGAEENGYGLIGVAPKVGIWSVKMLRFDEQGSISDLILGMQWAVEKRVKIIGMSLGTEEENQALHEAVQAAVKAGVLLVAAAGNKGDRVLYPAAYPEVIAVAASDKEDGRAWFSNMGPEVELIAPGTDVLTTSPGGGFQTPDGTSFAVPHVIGVAALLFSMGIHDAQKVRKCMDETAQDLGLPSSAQGHGMVDAERAISCIGR
ncbi:S8 family serine peptidase [Candidatus Acetothermia bacterium]|nr:S8 family serine peptidase [Candidatus Acetothermia bacterium]MBI3643172.1 S8 family serine peptidase [Candidatus Acetothermia bacterium]